MARDRITIGKEPEPLFHDQGEFILLHSVFTSQQLEKIIPTLSIETEIGATHISRPGTLRDFSSCAFQAFVYLPGKPLQILVRQIFTYRAG